MKLPKLRKTLRYVYFRSVRVHGRPREVALGMAIGLAVGMTPTMGFQMVIAAALAALLGQSKISAALGVWISNPLTAPLIYVPTYTLGAWVLGCPLRPPHGFLETITDLHDLTASIFAPLWVGGLLAAVPVGIAGYWLTYQAVIAYRLKVRHRRAASRHHWTWSAHEGWHRVNRPRTRRREGTVDG